MNVTSTPARAIPIDSMRVGADRWVSIRPIERSDAPGLSDFYAGLSRESRRRRFLGSAPGLESRLIRAFTEPDGQGLVGILSERGRNDGAVVAHASVQAVAVGPAEIAFAVADELQGRGLGRVLVKMAIDQARARGLRRVIASLLAENAPMRRLLLGSGCEVVADDLDGGVEEVTLRIAAA